VDEDSRTVADLNPTGRNGVPRRSFLGVLIAGGAACIGAVLAIPLVRLVPRVLSSICPHLGCTVQWRAEKDRFICPCHGGTYAPDGARLAGPPNRGMDELPTRIQNGRLAVRFEYFKQLAATKEVLD
jgi:hypothetical protein